LPLLEVWSLKMMNNASLNALHDGVIQALSFKHPAAAKWGVEKLSAAVRELVQREALLAGSAATIQVYIVIIYL